MHTIAEAIAEGAARLEACAIAEPRRTAGVLLCHTLGIERTHLLTRAHDSISETDYSSYLRLVERRSAGEPLQYITGHQEFYGLDFAVSPDVLIPRPETEFLVERVIKLAGTIGKDKPVIADVGTGSGCIAVAIAVNLPQARVIATDVSEAALDIARTNAAANGVSDRIKFLSGDLLAPVADRKGSIDIIASNPPYVNEGRPDLIQREVRDWEPRVALYGGSDGLHFYRRLLSNGLQFVSAGGFMVFEIGYSQLEAVVAMISASPWQLIEVARDLQDIPRTITVRKLSENDPSVRLND